MRLGRNDPCHCGSGKKYKHCHLDVDESKKAAPSDEVWTRDDIEASLPEGREFEGSIAQLHAMLSGRSRRRTAVDAAQELMYRAWEERSTERRIALAREALEVSPDCADAYALLADEAARSQEEVLALYEQAMAAAERALGKKPFEENVGHFWGLLETRPYMRARGGLAQCLRHLGDRDGAVGHFQELLRLNPNDNQGVRYQLAACLLEAGRDVEVAQLLAKYEEDGTAFWVYSAALLAFRRHGPGGKSSSALEAARQQNPHVPAFLLGAKKLPRHLPDYIGFGDEQEAIAYAAEHGDAWKSTRGALDWLAGESTKRPRARSGTKKQRAAAKGRTGDA